MSSEETENRLCEKHRPKNLEEILDQTFGEGQPSNLTKINNALSRKVKPHFMLVGQTPGTGKTTTAQAIAHRLFGGTYADRYKGHYHEFNASDDRGINVVREDINTLCDYAGERIIVLEEADEMTPPAQNALRRRMETAKGTIFILTGNSPWKFIEPLQSRCTIIRFRRHDDNTVIQYVLDVCKKEGIKVFANPNAKKPFAPSDIKPECLSTLTQLAKGAKGDLRRALNTLEGMYNANKEITAEGALKAQKVDQIGESLKITLAGDFERGKQMLTDAFLEKANIKEFCEELSLCIDTLPDREIKIRLHRELATVERACTVGSDPIVQFNGFIAFAWLAPHMNKSCPAINKQ